MVIDYWTTCDDFLLVLASMITWRAKRAGFLTVAGMEVLMTIDAVTEMTNNALFLIIQVAIPVLLVSLIVGLVVSIFQTVTSIQEQTLTFVPKIISIFLTLALIGGWMMTKMVDFTTQLWGDFSLYIHR